MFFQLSILVFGVGVVIAQEDGYVSTSTTTEVPASTTATTISASTNKATCQSLYPNSSTVDVVEYSNGCMFVCQTDNFLTLLDFRTAPDGQACVKEGNSCYQGSCYETKDIETCRSIVNGTAFTSISSNDCQVTCSSGIVTVASKNSDDGIDCTPVVPITGSQYECQDGSCVVTSFAFPSPVAPGGSFPALAPIIINPSRNPTRVPIPSPSP